MLVYLKALQYSMSESDQLNSTNNTVNTFISLDQASTIMADQTQGGNPQQYAYRLLSQGQLPIVVWNKFKILLIGV